MPGNQPSRAPKGTRSFRVPQPKVLHTLRRCVFTVQTSISKWLPISALESQPVYRWQGLVRCSHVHHMVAVDYRSSAFGIQGP